MNVTIEMANPAELDDVTLQEICAAAAAGFGRNNDQAMQADTINHVRTANQLQLARSEDDGRLAAFAMYAPCLWRPCR